MSNSLTCIFWNVNRADRTDLICRLALEKESDVIVLAESGSDRERLLQNLRENVGDSFQQPVATVDRFQLFARHHEMDLREVYGDVSGRVSIRLLKMAGAEFLLVAVHLQSKMNLDGQDQLAEATTLADAIRREEKLRGHERTVVVGDFNMNPFDSGVVAANGFHAMMTRAGVSDGTRTIQGRQYPFFYNPMWGFFGDRTPGPAGTIYYRRPGQISYDWDMFDQVLIRPAALPWFQGEVEIVTKIGDDSLLKENGRPNPDVGSDHLPIVFQLRSIE